jgi:MOSC domain-containing protein YiiM
MPSNQAHLVQPRVFQINVSNGGVPKLALRRASLSTLGIQGDQHRNLKHHGGPERAVCLYSLEHIQALQAEGHPIFPGSVGENITLSGLDWSLLAPGARLQLGEKALLEMTSYTEPCANIRESFDQDQIARIAQDRNPGWSRLYARVLVEGEISVGDPVTLLA